MSILTVKNPVLEHLQYEKSTLRQAVDSLKLVLTLKKPLGLGRDFLGAACGHPELGTDVPAGLRSLHKPTHSGSSIKTLSSHK